MLVLADGQVQWDEGGHRFDPQLSDAAPPALTEPGSLPAEPLYLDVTGDAPWDYRSPVFRDKITALAAPIHGKPKDQLASDDLREQRRFRRLRSCGGRCADRADGDRRRCRRHRRRTAARSQPAAHCSHCPDPRRRRPSQARRRPARWRYPSFPGTVGSASAAPARSRRAAAARARDEEQHRHDRRHRCAAQCGGIQPPTGTCWPPAVWTPRCGCGTPTTDIHFGQHYRATPPR